MVQLDRLPVSSRDPPVSTSPEPGRKKKGGREGRREEGCSGGNVKANFQLIKRRILLQFELFDTDGVSWEGRVPYWKVSAHLSEWPPASTAKGRLLTSWTLNELLPVVLIWGSGPFQAPLLRVSWWWGRQASQLN